MKIIIDGVSKGLAGQFEVFAKENKGMFRMLGIDCDENEHVCKRE